LTERTIRGYATVDRLALHDRRWHFPVLFNIPGEDTHVRRNCAELQDTIDTVEGTTNIARLRQLPFDSGVIGQQNSLHGMRGTVLQDDGVLLHRAKEMKEALNAVRVIVSGANLHWPANSADFNPNGQMWGMGKGSMSREQFCSVIHSNARERTRVSESCARSTKLRMFGWPLTFARILFSLSHTYGCKWEQELLGQLTGRSERGQDSLSRMCRDRLSG
jgi:hypothetical protein